MRNMQNVQFEDLEFEGERLTKVNPYDRPQYLDGFEQLALIHRLAVLLKEAKETPAAPVQVQARGSTVVVKCETCKQPFTARVADRKRGWGRYCSKSCKAIKQTQRTGRGAPRSRDDGDDYNPHPFSCEGLGQWDD